MYHSISQKRYQIVRCVRPLVVSPYVERFSLFSNNERDLQIRPTTLHTPSIRRAERVVAVNCILVKKRVCATILLFSSRDHAHVLEDQPFWYDVCCAG